MQVKQNRFREIVNDCQFLQQASMYVRLRHLYLFQNKSKRLRHAR